MPTLLPHRDLAPPKQCDFSPILVLIVAALAVALIWVEAQMLGGADLGGRLAEPAAQQQFPAQG